MLAVVLSDTHVRRGGARRLPDAAYAALDRADVILHAGDVLIPELLDELSSPSLAVASLGSVRATGVIRCRTGGSAPTSPTRARRSSAAWHRPTRSASSSWVGGRITRAAIVDV
jgi:hypothetical protein